MGNLKMKSLSALMLFVTMTIFLINGSLAKNLKKKYDNHQNLKVNKNLLQNSLVQTFTTDLLHSGNALTKNPIKVFKSPFHKREEVAAIQTQSKDIAGGHQDTTTNAANLNTETAVHVNIPAAQAHADAQVNTVDTAQHEHSATEEAATNETNTETTNETATNAANETNTATNMENDDATDHENNA